MDVITHSTGGLVARTYIQSGAAYGGEYTTGKTLPKINNLIMIGVPNQGASKAWNPLHDNWEVDPAFQIVLSKIINRAYQKVLNTGVVIAGPDYNISLASITAPQCLDLPEVCFINQYVPTARALLATYNFIDFGSGLTNVNSDPNLRNALLLDLNAGDPNAFATKVTARPTIIYGTNGADTPTTVVQEVGPTFTLPPLFYPIAEFAHVVGRDAVAGEIYYSDTKVPNGGDGTVPLISSEGQFKQGSVVDRRVTLKPFTKSGLFTIGNTSDDVNHTALPYNTDVQKAILTTLGVSCPAPGCTISTGKHSSGANAATACAAGCSNFGLDPVDGFMVDAQGRRLGFSAGTGPLAEIPGSVWFGNSEGMGWVFGPVEEPVRVELTGLGQDYYVDASVLSPTGVADLTDRRFLALGDRKILPMPLMGTTTVADNVPPVTATGLSPQPNAAGWNKSDVVVALSATDNAGGSGVKDITYSAAGAQLIANTTVTGASVAISVATEGQTTVTFFARDNAGNAEPPQTITVNLDKTPPVIAASTTPPSNAAGWNNTDVVVSFQCQDGLSGLAAGSPPADTVVSGEGANQAVSGACQDIPGNSVLGTVSRIKIDKTSPTLSCGASPNTLWPPNHKLVTVNPSIVVMDPLSGPAGFTLQSITSDEPDTGAGSGDIPNDIQGFVTGTASTTGQLRAERSGTGTGRVYTLTYKGVDLAGNSSVCTTTVSVPHNQ